jgi:hypothetical protein
VQIGAGNFDAIFNAFHRDALDSLLVRRISRTNSYSTSQGKQKDWFCHTNTHAETTCSTLPSPFGTATLLYKYNYIFLYVCTSVCICICTCKCICVCI